MSTRIGYDPSRAGEHSLSFALTIPRCVFCPGMTACGAHLATAGAQAPDFCPNAISLHRGATA